MLSYLNRYQKQLGLIVKTQTGELNLLDIIEDNTYNPDLLIEERRNMTIEDITEIHAEIVEQLKIHSYLIMENREKGIRKIAEILEIDKDELEEKILEIQIIIFKSGLVRYDKKGRLISMMLEEV